MALEIECYQTPFKNCLAYKVDIISPITNLHLEGLIDLYNIDRIMKSLCIYIFFTLDSFINFQMVISFSTCAKHDFNIHFFFKQK